MKKIEFDSSSMKEARLRRLKKSGLKRHVLSELEKEQVNVVYNKLKRLGLIKETNDGK